MTSQRKNILVGLTVLGAFVVLGWMIIQFGGRLGNLTTGKTYPVQLAAPSATGLSEGAPVQYLGLPVGRVHSVRLNKARNGFNIELRINQGSNLPANITATIRSINPISGAAAVVLEPDGPIAEGTLQQVPPDRVIVAQVASTSLVPEEFSLLAADFRLLVQEFRAAGTIENVNRQVEEIGALARSMNELVGDDGLRSDVRATVSSVREAAASAERVGKQMEEFTARMQAMQTSAEDVLAGARDVTAQVRQTAETADGAILSTQQQVENAGKNVDEISRELIGRLEQMNGILADVQQITAAIEEGKGTAGKMIYDDRLYEGLVINMQLLESTIRTSNRLLQQWEQEGIRLRLFR